MINIAYMIDTISSPYAGTERQLLQTIGRLDRNRVKPHLICLRDSEWFRSADLGIPSETILFRSLKSLDYLRGRRRFRQFCLEHGINVVQTFFHDANLVGTLWARAAGVPVVIASRRNLGSGYWHNGREIAILRWLRGKTDHYIANSEAAAKEAIEVEKLEANRITSIPNGLDLSDYGVPDKEIVVRTRRSWGFDEGHTVIGAVANLRPIKNLPFFVRCARRIADRYPQARFVILGEGDQRGELQRMVDELGLGDRFVLPGRSTSVSADLYGFDIAVLCSKGESLSNALMEYMATGRPSIVSDVGGNSELINSPELGRIYRPEDEEGFLKAIAEYVDNPQLRDGTGRNACESIRERCSWEVTLGRVTELYESLLARKSRDPVKSETFTI